MKILLDSSAIIAYLKGDDKVKDEIDAADGVYCSSLCAFGVLLGESYAKLKGFGKESAASSFLEDIAVIPFVEEDARIAAEAQALLISKGISANGFDVLIAASASRNGLAIVTKDRDYFRIGKLLEVSVRIV